MGKRIELDDHGQDFLWWEIDDDGVVTGCGPMQGWVWVGVMVLNHADLEQGDVLHIQTQDGRTTTLNYRCREVQSLDIQ